MIWLNNTVFVFIKKINENNKLKKNNDNEKRKYKGKVIKSS